MPLEAKGRATGATRYFKFYMWFGYIAKAFWRFFFMPAKKKVRQRFSFWIKLCFSKYMLSCLSIILDGLFIRSL